MTRDSFFTSIALNYLHKALALASSVFTVYADAKFVVSVIDYRWLSEQQRSSLQALTDAFAARGHRLEFFDPLELYDNPILFRYKYNVVEACTSIKPALALHLLESAQTVTYLDPDAILYAPIPQHPDAADVWDVQVTPHVLGPATRSAPISERLFMFYGTFNLGYFAVRRSDQSVSFLKWWKTFCEHHGADAPQAGLFVDQKPVDLLPCFVDRVSVLRHAGCNAGWWNLFCDGREMTSDGAAFMFEGRRHDLVFFHFSNLDREPDPAKRLVANPLQIFDDGMRGDLRMSANPALRELFSDYHRRVGVWAEAMPVSQPGDASAAHHADAPPLVRLLLAEAVRRGMTYRGDPFADGAARVTIKSLRHIVRRLSARDLKASLAALAGAARLALAPSLIRHLN